MQPPEPSRPALDLGSLDAPGWRVEVLGELPSTNAYLAELARAGASAGRAVVAEHQSAGRGRLDRVWVTPPRAALTVSLLVAPDRVPLARWPWLPLLTGLAVREAVRRAAGVECGLKWPNDVLAGARKLAGILVERVERPAGAVAVVGIGVNVTTSRDELPVRTATSLALEGATSVDRTRLLAELLAQFTERYDGWVAAAGEGLRPSYASACSTIGRQVRVDLPTGESLHGEAVDVDHDGRLVVDDGHRRRALGAGDVVHVRGGESDDPA